MEGARRERIEIALQHILVASYEATGEQFNAPGAAVKWPQEIGAVIGAVTHASMLASMKNDGAEVRRLERIRDGVLWDIAVLLGLEDEEIELTAEQMGERLLAREGFLK